MKLLTNALLLGLAAVSLAAYGCSSSGTSSSNSTGTGSSSSTSGAGGAGGADTTSGAGGSGGTGGAGGSTAACEDFSGAYIPTGAATCDSGLVPPLGVCVVQDGCAVTLGADAITLIGTADGAKISGSGKTIIKGIEVQEDCSGERGIDGVVTVTCSITGAGLNAKCTIPFAPQKPAPPATSFCCDVVKQGPCADGERCSVSFAANETTAIFPSCNTSGGPKKDGEECARVAIGDDDCGAGLYCAGVGSATGKFNCRPFCHTPKDCPVAGDACVAVIASAPREGYCLQGCDLFSDTCGAGKTCRSAPAIDDNAAATRVPVCTVIGAAALNEQCAKDSDCPANAICGASGGGTPYCRALCDGAHPCVDPLMTCKVAGGIPGHPDLGVCVP